MNNTNSKIGISIIIPAYNEYESLPILTERLVNVLGNTGKSYEIIFMDDGSTDTTFEVLKDLKNKYAEVKMFSFQRNFGKSAALSKGFQEAEGEIVFTMDADLQDDPEEIPSMIKKLEEGYGLVSGWKKERKDGFIKNKTSKIFNYVTSKLTGLYLHDHNCGLKCYKKEVLQYLDIYGELHRYIPVFVHANGFKVTELPVKHQKREHGVTKYGTWRFIAGYLDLITVVYLTRFQNRPMHFFGVIGSIPFFLGALLNAYITFQKYAYGIGMSNRPALLLGILLMILGFQFFSLGLIGEMQASHKQDKRKYIVKYNNE